MQYVALIRNVMVGRQGPDRETLIRCFEDAGATDVQSHLATGNVSFSCAPKMIGKVQLKVEPAICAVIGRPEPVILRSGEELRALVAAQPFAQVTGEGLAFEVTFADPRDPALSPKAFADFPGLNVIACNPHELLTAQTIGSKVRHPLPIVEKLSGRRATTRAWNTVVRLASL